MTRAIPVSWPNGITDLGRWPDYSGRTNAPVRSAKPALWCETRWPRFIEMWPNMGRNANMNDPIAEQRDSALAELKLFRGKALRWTEAMEAWWINPSDVNAMIAQD